MIRKSNYTALRGEGVGGDVIEHICIAMGVLGLGKMGMGLRGYRIRGEFRQVYLRS